MINGRLHTKIAASSYQLIQRQLLLFLADRKLVRAVHKN